MDNAEKLQDVSEEVKNETPEEVQNTTELTDENMKEDGEGVEENTESLATSDEVVAERTTEVSESNADSTGEGDEESSEEGEEHDDHEEELDLDHATKKEVYANLKEVKNEDNIKLVDRILKATKPRFDELYELSKNEALQRFVTDGNEADSFEYHGDDRDKEFISLYNQLKSRRNKHYKDLQDQREDNLKRK